MSISFSGLGSGLDTSSWVEALVTVKQQDIKALQTKLKSMQSVKTTVNDTRSVVSSLRTAIERLTDAKFGGTMDLFSQNTATSSNNDLFTATATSSAARQNYDITVQQLATFTKATSKEAVSAVADDNTELKNIGITKGLLTVYVNGQKQTVNIDDTTTLGDLKAQLAGFGVKTDVTEDGVLRFSAQSEGDTINFGSTTDTTNLVSLVGLSKTEDGTYESSSSLYKASVASVLTSENSGFKNQITEGTFTIGGATFTINDKTTLSSLISEINSNDEAQAYAFWDDASGKMTITSKKEGASYINIEAGSSNFTDVMGFTTTETDGEGRRVSKLYTDAQELGLNAKFTINGTSMVSTSNTVTSDVSRIEGVTITLNRANKEDEGSASLKVGQNTSELVNALKSFVSAYNECISKIDSVTANDGDLHGESSLRSLKNTIRSYATGANTTNGGIYKLLSDIGISTSTADSTNLSNNTNDLKLDEDKLLKALEENPESVKNLIAGENGVFSLMENTLEQNLKASVGYFDIKTQTLDSDIKKMNDKITKKNKSISNYRSQLENKFRKMEQAITSMQQNYSKFFAG